MSFAWLFPVIVGVIEELNLRCLGQETATLRMLFAPYATIYLESCQTEL